MNDAETMLDEIWQRILVNGEDPAEVEADFERRRAERRAAFEAERARLQAEADACTAVMLGIEGRLQ